MQKRGLATLEGADANAPPGITEIKGEWPGVRASRDSSAGPTGVPWLDSNGWQVRLARIREPEKTIWVETPLPKEKRVMTATAYVLAIADAATYGGRWIINLDAEPSPDTWNRMMTAVRFFNAHKDWTYSAAQGVIGIEFTGEELMNLTARQNQPYRILTGQESWKGLKAILWETETPPADTRSKLLAFAQAGGLVIASGKWAAERTPADSHPRYSIRRVGQGRIASGDLSDPYQAAADAQILLSHRHDLVRFWNGGSLGSYLTTPPSGKGALLQIVNYAGRPGADPVSVRIAGPYREARIQQLDDAAPKPLKTVAQKEAIELHLPAIPVYAAIELI
jgi:hypothetical protein